MDKKNKWVLSVILSHPCDKLGTIEQGTYFNSEQDALDKMRDMCNGFLNGGVREDDKYSTVKRASRYNTIITNNLGFDLEFKVYKLQC